MRPSVRGRGCRGVSAIEFALISPIFFSVVCIFFEMSLILFTQSVLDDATRYAARFVKTRQVTTGTAFKTAVCAEIGAMIPCADVQYYVQSGNTFSAMNATVQTNAQGNMTSNGMFFSRNRRPERRRAGRV
ncbi:MAG: TadE/TadG family type IV pilus assembly protein [Alphaproteobacteria bacterium]